MLGRSREVLKKTVDGNENVSGKGCRHAGLNGCVIGMEGVETEITIERTAPFARDSLDDYAPIKKKEIIHRVRGWQWLRRHYRLVWNRSGRAAVH